MQGGNRNKHGKQGEDLVLLVPCERSSIMVKQSCWLTDG